MSEQWPPPLFWPIASPPASAAAAPARAQSAMRLAARYAAAAGQSDDLQALQQEACFVAAEGLESGFAKLLAYDSGRQDFLVVAGVGWQPGVVGYSRLDADTGTAAGFAWHTGESVICNALGNDRRFRVPRLLVEHGLARSINVPIAGDAQDAFGVLEVESPERGEFTAEDVWFLQLLARSMAAARNRLMRQALHDEQVARSGDDNNMSLQEMQHRVRNDLQGICSSLDREGRKMADEEQRGGYDRVGRQVQALAALYNYLAGARSGGPIDMGAYLGSLCMRIEAAGALASRGIAVGVETQPVSMAIDRAGRLAIAVNELVANAAEHAFPDGRGGKIMVRLFAQTAGGSGSSVVTVGDDGCGFKGPRPGSNGLSFVERLVRGAGGVLTRSEGEGTEWRIALSS